LNGNIVTRSHVILNGVSSDLTHHNISVRGASEICDFNQINRIVNNVGKKVNYIISLHYVVTEYGIAYMFGKNIRQRAYELIKIAHPDHRERLEKEAFDRMKCMPSP